MVNNYIVIDLETTGLKPKYDRIIEIGAVKVRNGEVVDTFQRYVNPEMEISEQTKLITKIRQEDLNKADYIENILEEFLEFLGEDPIIGHNVLFDYAFLKKMAIQYNYDFEKSGIDTLRLARTYILESPCKRLEALCQFFGIIYTPHRALEDAKATQILYQKIMEYSKEAREVLPIKLHARFKKESPITQSQSLRLQGLIQRHRLEVSYDIYKLTKNQASRYTDQILATYGR